MKLYLKIKGFIQENAFEIENIVCKMAAIFVSVSVCSLYSLIQQS